MIPPPATRDLIVKCAGPEPATLDLDGSWSAGRVRLRFAPLEELHHLETEFLGTLDAGERARAQRFRFAADRSRFILAHGWLRMWLAERLGADPAGIMIKRGPFGKPFVEHPTLQFNLSDTKDAVLLAMTDGPAIGADVETMTRRVDHAAVSAHYFTAREDAGIGMAADPKRRFLELWTRKEAVLKASGVGIMDDLHVLQVDQPVNHCVIDHPEFVRHAAPAYDVHTWHIHAGHIVSLAVAKDHPR